MVLGGAAVAQALPGPLLDPGRTGVGRLGLRPAHAAEVILESISYDGITGVEPDPALFVKSGDLTPLPTQNIGLVIVDPSNEGSLFYTHATQFLAKDPADPNFKNLASVTCRLRLPDPSRCVLGLCHWPPNHSR